MIRQLVGDARAQLATLEAGSVQCCITSPPYLGLRDYGTPPLVWGGDAECAHSFVATTDVVRHQDGKWKHGDAVLGEDVIHRFAPRGDSVCPCGAWLGSLGLEPTPDLYLEHLVEVFRGVRRVLRPDGVLWVNLGDSYAGSGNGAHDYRERNKNRSLSLHPDKYVGQSTAALQRVGPQEHTEGAGRVWGYKPKDLMMMPARLAMALQADGWWLRSMIPWLKRNSMPESVTDRPATSVEYVFLLSKSRTYYWDADAVRVKVGEPTRRNAEFRGVSVYKDHIADGVGNSAPRPEGKSSAGPKSMDGRNRRNSDWFFESWQGLMLDEQDDPLALVVNPQPFKGSHFATFPPKLVEPMIKASTRPGDVVLDPFGGAGTVGLVADRLGRDAILIDLKPGYAEMAAERLTGDAPLFVELSA